MPHICLCFIKAIMLAPRLRSRRLLGGVGFGFLRSVGYFYIRLGYFYPTPTVQLNHFNHYTPKLGILTRACWYGTVSFEMFMQTEIYCCVPRFPLVASCYKIVNSQTSFMLCYGVGVGHFGKVGIGVGHFNSNSVTLVSTIYLSVCSSSIPVLIWFCPC